MQLNELVKEFGGICTFGNGLIGCGEASSAAPQVGAALSVSAVQFDSREVRNGDLFVAVPGTLESGADYLADAAGRGAVAVLTPAGLDLSSVHREMPGLHLAQWIHPAARRLGGEVAARLLGNPTREMQLAAITGTNGKTSTAHILGHLLQAAGRSPAVLGTAGHRLAGGAQFEASHTTPDAPRIQGLLAAHRERGGDAAVLEVSSHALSQERTAGLDFSVAVFTNLSVDHLDYHGSMEEYAATKALLFGSLSEGSCAVINADDSFADMMIHAARACGARVVTYSTRRAADLTAVLQRTDLEGSSLTINGMGISTVELRMPLAGRYNVDNALAAAAAALVLGASPSQVVEGLATTPGAPGRLERIPSGQRGCSVFVDYAHSEDALGEVLGLLHEEVPAGARLLTVFGCGGDRDPSKRAPMGRVAAGFSDRLFITSDNPRGEDPLCIIDDILMGVRQEEQDDLTVEVEPDRRRAIQRALECAREGDVVLIAGKGHETRQVIGDEVRCFSDRAVVMETLAPGRGSDGGFLFRDLLEACPEARSVGADQPDRHLAGVATDTRELRAGELFCALSGPNFDGNDFAAAAGAAGAGALLLRGNSQDLDARQVFAELSKNGHGELAVALHPDPQAALGQLAAWHRQRLNCPVVAVTGSCGKTTTKDILATLLATPRRVSVSPRSFNNAIGVPRTLLAAPTDTETLVVEMGTSGPGEIDALCGLAAPTGGVITNIGASHLAGLGSLEGVAREKGALAESLPADGFLVLNAHCPWTPSIAARTAARVITFSVDGCGELNATDLHSENGCSLFKLGELEIALPMLGMHNVQNLLAALGVCLGLGLELCEVLPAVAELKGSHRRLQAVPVHGLALYDDTYNANPQSVGAGLRFLCGQHGHARRVLVLGDMLELGRVSGEEHHALGLEIARRDLDLVLLVGEHTLATAAGALAGGLQAERVVHFQSTADAWNIIPGLLRDGDVCLVKGSRALGLERVIRRLVEVRG
ncbi:MAG: UDP-N-acetylmuramoyl-L-alanyl-D-glutamate--2,6-diaminopimelate ligase [Planctomycetota bacterium]|nr:UDP-N-acetylmuramoyl-L-alanyl-D-glutamate--2,6-diaminopimelate ligase [Planctomycetota bacterium]